MNNRWSEGWGFYKSAGSGNVPGENDPDLIDWMKGFGAAMADYDLECEHPSIQAALLHYGIDADLLAASLNAAEKIIAEPEFNRWPTVPVRGYGENSLRAGPCFVILLDAANDD